MASEESIELLIRAPRESLAVEMKAWIRPDRPKEKAKIIKALLALRNNNGGYLLIGFDDDTAQPIPCPPDLDVAALYHPDAMQELAAKYASEPFEVVTHQFSIQSSVCVVLQVPSGLRVPVVAKRALVDSGIPLVAEGALFVRTLNANNRASTSLIGVKDWPALVERCFDNRESDIGRFLRRHLGGEGAERFASRFDALRSKTDPALEYLRSRTPGFIQRASECKEGPPMRGSVEVAVVTHKALAAGPPTSDLLSRVMAANPQLSGWPAWVDSRSSAQSEFRPKVIDGGWETFIHTQLFGAWAFDDWRIEPQGRLYLGRAFRDDLLTDRGPAPGSAVDFALQIVWLAETLKTASMMLDVLGATAEADLSVAIRWSGLKGRQLVSWMDPGRTMWPGRTAHQDELAISEPMTLEQLTATRVVVERLASQFFVLFDGHTVSPQAYDELVAGRLARTT